MNSSAIRKHILVVEDNDDVRKVVTTYLSANGYRVTEAVDGLAGFEQAVSSSPDLILYDVLLPKLDGIESLKRLRKTPEGANIPVVMMSAVLQTRDIQSETSRLNVSGFLQKPFQVRSLLKIVQDVLGASDANAEESVSKSIPPVSSVVPAASGAAVELRRIVALKEKLPTRGRLQDFSLPRVIHNVFSSSLTGRIRIVSGTTEKRIYFQNGFPVYAESSIPEETLGAHLVQKKKITLQDHMMVQKAMKISGRHYGEELLRTNILGPHELFMELEAHLAEKVVTTFAWTQGQFLFEPGDTWKDDVIIARMKPGRIILDGIRRCWNQERIQETGVILLHSRAFVLEDSPYHDDLLALSTQEARILQIAARERSVEGVLNRVKAEEQETVLQTLFAFYIIGKIGFVVEGTGQVVANTVSPPPHRPSRPPVSNQDERAQALLSEYIKYRTADYFKLLGVSRDAGDDEIRKGYEIRKKRYHPDTLIGIDTGLVHEKMEELYMRIHTAYQTLISPEEKRKYIASLEGEARGTMLTARSKTGRQSVMIHRTRDESCYESGFQMLRNGEYAEALRQFKEAEDIDPKVKYTVFRIWAAFLVDPVKKAASTEKEMKELFQKNKDEALIPYLLGNYYLRMKNKKDAETHFERALRIDPQNIDAQRQLRILRMRKQTETSGLFDLLKLKK